MTDSSGGDRIDAALDRVDEAKRSSLRKIVLGSAFVAPAVASFAINGMMVTPAIAANLTNSSISSNTPS
ncbi:MAG: hypothetical protein ACTHOR_03585 [Devosia sp.]